MFKDEQKESGESVMLITLLFYYQHAWFKYILFRIKAEKSAKKEGDIFDAKKEGYKPSEQRKKDQAEIDKQVINPMEKMLIWWWMIQSSN